MIEILLVSWYCVCKFTPPKQGGHGVRQLVVPVVNGILFYTVGSDGSGKQKMGFYITAIIISLVNFIYIYGYKFDSLSEEELVLYSPLWLLLFIFGTHGLVAAKLVQKIDAGKYQNMREALVQSSKAYGIFGPLRQLFFFPLIVVNIKSAILLAVLSTLIWGALLVLFFQFVFPEL